MDKNLNKTRLDELAADFGNPASRRLLVQEFGNHPDALWGKNENGENVELSIRKDGITERVYQNNGWVRVNEYGAEGQIVGETYEGRWSVHPSTTDVEDVVELELLDKQIERNDEIFNAALDFCKVLTENDALEWNGEIIGQLADFAAELLTTHGNRVRFPVVVTERDGSQHYMEYYGEDQ